MGSHTARLIFTVLFFIFALQGFASGFWAAGIFWVFVTMATGYPFVRNGRIDLEYDDGPKSVYIVSTPPGGAH